MAPRRSGRPVTIDAERALDSAVAHFWRNGFEATNLEEIAAAIGVTKPTLYRHFGDKAALFVHALAHYQARNGQELAAALEAPRVGRAVAGFLETAIALNTRPGGPRGCLVSSTAAAEAGRSQAAADFAAAAFREAETRIAARLARARAAGELPPAFPVRERARMLLDFQVANAARARLGEPRAALLAAARAQASAVLALP